MTDNFRLISLKGHEISPYLSSIAKLEIDVLSEYPYLYQEDLACQINLVKRYVECTKSIVVLVMEGDSAVGVSSGIPLYFDSERFKKPFIDNGIDVQKVYYLGDSVLLPMYRGRSIYREFFAKREAAAIEHGCTISSFISVERLLNDPRRPNNYVPLDAVWQRFGYIKHPELFVELEWKDVGDEKLSKKKLVYWLKLLE
jgi:hypothetical protein